MDLKFSQLMDMAEDLLDLTDNGWSRTIYFDQSKLAEEVGEVAECLNKSSKTDEDLAEELSDVVAVCCVIALKKGIDLNTACLKKQKKRIDKLVQRFHEGMFPEGFMLRVNV